MKTRQLAALFLCELVVLLHNQGLGSLLAVRAMALGASPALAGYFVSSTALCLALGTMVAGRLSDTIQHRKAILTTCFCLEILILLVTSRATVLWQFVLLTDMQWLVGGCAFTLLPILAGLFAGREERGHVFGVLAAATGLAALIGGLSAGPVVDRWGYRALFVALALVYCCAVPVAAFVLEDKVVVPAPRKQSGGAAPAFGSRYYLLVAAGATAAMARAMGDLGRSLAMKQDGFSAAGITATVAALGVLTLLLAPLLGRLSDRAGRRRTMALGYVLACAGLCLYAFASLLWQFMAATALVGIIMMVGGGAGRAFVADLIPPASLGRGIARYSAFGSIAYMCGSALMGNAAQVVGMQGAFLLAALLPLAALALVLRIRPAPSEDVSLATTVPAQTKAG